MGSPASKHMFHGFSYEKTLDEIKDAMTKKVVFLKSKILDRESRIVRIREEFKITDADMIDLLSQAAREAVSNRAVTMSYNVNSTGGEQKIVAAGVVQNLLTEKTLIEQEKESMDQLNLIVRNLRPVTHHTSDGTEYMQSSWTLNESELEFLGF